MADPRTEEISIEEDEITLLQIVVVVLITETAEKAATSRRSLPLAGADHLTENMKEDEGRREILIEGREAGGEVGEEDIAEVGGMSGVAVGEAGEVADLVVDGLLSPLAPLGQTSSAGLYRPGGMKDLQVRVW